MADTRQCKANGCPEQTPDWWNTMCAFHAIDSLEFWNAVWEDIDALTEEAS